MKAAQRPRYEPHEIDPEGAERALETAAAAGVNLSNKLVAGLVARVGAAAPAVLAPLLGSRGLVEQLAEEIAAHGHVAPAALPLPTHAPPGETIEQAKARIRRMRQAALARTALRELYASADVDRTAREWSHVAALCTAHALAIAEAAVEARNGPPLDERGERVPFVVLGMGKLGGEELNLGSDIDICFFYGTDEGAAGARTLNEHFGRVGTLVADLLGEVTAEGFAFRVDLRLRPEGSRGAVSNSLASAERYYETWGRSWERAALLRARPVAGHAAFGESLLDALRPFVFRRAVDPRIATDVAEMLQRARREQLQDDARDLKLGRGGIREAEFFVQSLQLVWGGRHRSLQVPNTLSALARLRALGLLSHREAEDFADAWALLRRVEHRVQVMAAYATHLLPEDAARRRALARSLDYSSFDALESALASARAKVRALFDTLFQGGEGSPDRPPSTLPASPEAELADMVATGVTREVLAEHACEVLGVRDPEGAVDDLLRLARRADMPLGAFARDRYRDLGPRLLAEVRDAPDPDRALAHLAELFGRMRGAERYVRLLAEAPQKLRGLVGLFGASEALSKTLLARPDLLDAVVTGGAGAPSVDDIPTIVSSAAARALRQAGPDDDPVDMVVGALRRAQREVTLEIGLADMAGLFTAGEVSRRLSALADAVLREAFALAAREAAERYGTRQRVQGADRDPGSGQQPDPLEGVAVFAMGSLAAGEMGYGGDLDLIVLYEREGETCGGRRAGVSIAEYVARLTQRAIAFLSAPHSEGPGYAVDTRLRPSGSQGTLVVSLDAFVRYHAATQGQPGAQSWERQALIRSRFAAGDARFGAIASATIERVAYEQGPPDVAQILRLRERMEQELGAEPHGEVALKYGRGGLVDVEFAVQALQMAHGKDPRVRTPTTRRAIEALRETRCLDPMRASALFESEKLLRRALLASRFVAERSVLIPGSVATTTIARRLGYRDRGGRSAAEVLLADLAAARERVRRTFLDVIASLASK